MKLYIIYTISLSVSLTIVQCMLGSLSHVPSSDFKVICLIINSWVGQAWNTWDRLGNLRRGTYFSM